MTSLDSITGWLIQILLRGENDSKQSDEIQANGLTPLENLDSSTFLTLFFYSLKTLFHFIEHRQTVLLADFAKNKNMEKCQIFYQNHGL